MKKLGIIAGGGTAPQKIIDICLKTGRSFFVFCLEGQASQGLADGHPHIWVRLGAGGVLKDTIARQGIEEIVMIGRVARPSIRELQPDLWTMKVLAQLGFSLGDDGLLRGIAKLLEAQMGVKVIGAQDIFSDLLMPEGVLGNVQPDANALADIDRGMEVARLLGAADVGQAVVVQGGIVLGVEGAEGTDGLITRCGALMHDGAGAVLVKRMKPTQDSRFDLPTIGEGTIEKMHAHGLRGVAQIAGQGFLLDKDAVIRLADSAGIFVVGVKAS